MNPKYSEKARQLTAWLMNPVEIDHSDPMGESKARHKQAEDMQKLVAKALEEVAKEREEEIANLNAVKKGKEKCRCGHTHQCLVCVDGERHNICGRCDCIEFKPLKKPRGK